MGLHFNKTERPSLEQRAPRRKRVGAWQNVIKKTMLE